MTRLDPESSLVAPDQQASVQNNPAVVEEVLSGKETIVSHVGASQYQVGGIAACGLAGLNFVRIVLGRVEEGLDGGRLLEDVLSRRTSDVSGIDAFFGVIVLTSRRRSSPFVLDGQAMSTSK
jgi:hypothetical protein